MTSKCLISGLVAAVLSLALGYLVHVLLLGADYARLPNLFRTQADQAGLFPYLIIAHLVFGLALAWVYVQGKTAGASWLGQGVRYGIAVAALTVVPMYLIYYAVQPMPGAVVAKQIVFDAIVMLLLGIVVAYLNRAPGEA
jgi:hypothetical protein